MNADVRQCGNVLGSDWWSARRRTNNLGKIDVKRTNRHAAKRDSHGMLTWVTRLDDRCRMLQCRRAVVFVLVRRRGVMMSRVVVIAVLVDVQRRQHSRRRDETLNEHERDDTTHGDSLLRDLKDLQLLLPRPRDDSVEIVVFAGDGRIYLQQHRIRSGTQTIVVSVPSRPTRAGIDPRLLLGDWETADNVGPIRIKD